MAFLTLSFEVPEREEVRKADKPGRDLPLALEAKTRLPER
jgi:hypothetical protein